MPHFLKRKQGLRGWKSEGVGDSGEALGENSPFIVKLSGRIVRASGVYYEVFGGRGRCPGPTTPDDGLDGHLPG